MKTKPLKKQFIPRYCFIDNVHVFLIARTHEFPISLIALAAACAMNGLHCLCASTSMPGTTEVEAALGTGKVIRLSADALVSESKVLRNLVQRARDENAVLLIDAEVGPAFEFQGLDKAMDLKRRETLTVVLSLATHDLPSQMLNSSYWYCQPDHCIAHVIGAMDHDSCEANECDMISMVPAWHSGPIMKEMSDVLARRNQYRGLQPIPDVLSLYAPVPYCSLFNHDVHLDCVIQMLGQAHEHVWKHVISKIAEEYA